MTNLISLYFYIDERYNKEWKYLNERFSNNHQPAFTDVELLTVYCYGIMEEKRFKQKELYDFTKKYLLSWFPRLPSYQAFNGRINQMTEMFKQMLVECVLLLGKGEQTNRESVVDSLPIITCSGKRKGKVAQELTNKGYCSTKGMYYFGVKLHALGWARKGKLPCPENFVITPASENDLNVFREYWHDVEGRIIYGDKIYKDADWFTTLAKEKNSIMLTPVKAVKGIAERIKQMNKAADDLWSKAVSTVRQPIESLFNWLIEKVDLQRASKVRSTKGLIVHVYGKLAAAFIEKIIF